jgi:nitric-oxide synthase
MRLDSKSSSDPMRRRLRRLSASERREEATAFVRMFYRENNLSDAARRTRESEVCRNLRRNGYYEHTPEELAFGARVAWRNHSRCIGRLFWKSLEVIDCRTVTDPDEMAARIADHMTLASGDGRIRSMITIFPAARDHKPQPYIESNQIIQYAGYANGPHETIGDPLNVESTRIAMSLGWRPQQSPGMFDILPFIIRQHGGRRLLYELPATAIREVAITHPDYPAIDDLGIRWYSVPCVSSMIASIGGIDYPCAPFNGFYMGTEIASRNLGDKNRYNLLPRVAAAIGVPPSDPRSLWQDRSLLELNRAVLHSYAKAGVTIIDHHSASEQFVDFLHREQAAGRPPSADWSWIVPPQAASACPVFHTPMRDLHSVPNYYHSRASDGGELAPNYDDEQRGEGRQRWDRWTRRFRKWRRMRT